eukprot:ctg_6853.g533
MVISAVALAGPPGSGGRNASAGYSAGGRSWPIAADGAGDEKVP